LFRSTAIDKFFQHADRQISVHEQRDADTENQRPSLESAEDYRIHHEESDERGPDIDVADRGHEQVEHRVRPLLVDKMKQSLIHSEDLSFEFQF
jgi:hypothetical protein